MLSVTSSVVLYPVVVPSDVRSELESGSPDVISPLVISKSPLVVESSSPVVRESVNSSLEVVNSSL